MPKLPAQPNNSLIQGLQCLQAVVAADRPVGSRALARQMGMTHTRANRLLGTLAFIGLAERTADRKYRPGPGLHLLAAQSLRASRLLPAALPTLMRLRGEGFTVGLGMLWGGKVCYLFLERTWQGVEEAIGRHALLPAEHSSLGVALLAARPEGEPLPAEAVVPKVGENAEVIAGVRPSLLPGSTLADSVAEARRFGYAVRRYVGGEISIGVAIGRPAVAGLAVSAKHLGEENLPGIGQNLIAAAEAIGRELDASADPAKRQAASARPAPEKARPLP